MKGLVQRHPKTGKRKPMYSRRVFCERASSPVDSSSGSSRSNKCALLAGGRCGQFARPPASPPGPSVCRARPLTPRRCDDDDAERHPEARRVQPAAVAVFIQLCLTVTVGLSDGQKESLTHRVTSAHRVTVSRVASRAHLNYSCCSA